MVSEAVFLFCLRTFTPLERCVAVFLPLYSLAHLELFPFDGILLRRISEYALYKFVLTKYM